MAVTQEQIDKLRSAINSGALAVQDGRREVRYRSLDEMERTLGRMESDLAVAAGARRVRRLRVALGR